MIFHRAEFWLWINFMCPPCLNVSPPPALPLSTFYLHSANPTPSRDPSQRPLSAFLSNQYSEFDTQNKRFQARIYVGGRKSSICYSVPVLPHASQFFFSFLHLPANLMFLHSRFKKKIYCVDQLPFESLWTRQSLWEHVLFSCNTIEEEKLNSEIRE